MRKANPSGGSAGGGTAGGGSAGAGWAGGGRTQAVQPGSYVTAGPAGGSATANELRVPGVTGPLALSCWPQAPQKRACARFANPQAEQGCRAGSPHLAQRVASGASRAVQLAH